MRDYAQVRPRFWTHGTGKELRGDHEARELCQYLMSAPTSNMIGLYYLPVQVIQHELGYETLEGASEALRRVCKVQFAAYDAASEYVFVFNMAREQIAERLTPKDNRVKGIVAELLKHRCSPFFADFIERYRDAFCLDVWPHGEELGLSERKGLRRPSEGPSKPGTGTGTGTGTGGGEAPAARAAPPPAESRSEPPDEPSSTPEDPPELEPNEPPCDPRERMRVPALVRLEFERAYLSLTGNSPAWTADNAARCDTIAAWLDKNHGQDPRAALTRLLAGFFASARAAERSFPISFLATNPQEYFAPPKPLRDVRKGFVAPAPPSAFKATDIQATFKAMGLPPPKPFKSSKPPPPGATK